MKNAKKLIIIMLIAVCLVVSLCACDFRDTPCAKINAFLSLDYSATDVRISTKFDGDTLNSVFSMRKGAEGRTIQYSIQQFGTFDLSSSQIERPEDYIVTKRGSVTLKNGNVVEQNGDVVDVNFASLEVTKFDFNVDYFSSYTEGANFIKAEVSNPKAFLEDDTFEGTNMTVNANYGNSLEFITVKYTSANGAQVEIKYSFTI